MSQKKKEYPTYFLQPDFSERLDSFHEEFIELARRYFGSETSRIESYVERCKNDRERDGFTWATFSPEFYFAELAAIAVMNQSMWDDFCRAKQTIIFIPDCLSLMGDRCKRKGEKFLEECDQCVPNCVVNKIVALREKYNFREVFAYRDQTEQFKIVKEKYKSVGFLGIACILMLAEGMRSSMQSGIPAHGVPLQYCGCEHWVDKPFSTDTDLAKIERVLKAKAECRSAQE